MFLVWLISKFQRRPIYQVTIKRTPYVGDKDARVLIIKVYDKDNFYTDVIKHYRSKRSALRAAASLTQGGIVWEWKLAK